MANQNFKVKNGLEVGTGVTISAGIVSATKFIVDGSQIASSQWVTTSTGIHTLSSVGIGTTNPTQQLQVSGSTLISGTPTLSTTDLDGTSVKNVALSINPGIGYSATGTTYTSQIRDTFSANQNTGNHTSLAINSQILPTENASFSVHRSIVNTTIRSNSSDSYSLGNIVSGSYNRFYHYSTLNTSAYTNFITGTRNDVQLFSGSAGTIYGSYNYITLGNFVGFNRVTAQEIYGGYNSVNIGSRNDYANTVYGTKYEVTVNNTGIVTNYYGVHLSSTVSGTGSIQNNWSLYSQDTSAKMYHAGSIGIGTTNPQTKLEIDGTIGFTNGNIKIGDSLTGSNLAPNLNLDNIFIGKLSGGLTTSGDRNIFMGTQAGFANTTGFQNIFIGQYSGLNNKIGSSNIFLGLYSGLNNTTGGVNNFIGFSAGENNKTGYENNFFGYYSGDSNISGYQNNFFGNYSGYNNITGSNNIYIGNYTGISTSASNKVIIGRGVYTNNFYNFDSPDTTKNIQFAVGVRTDANPSKYWLVGNENFNVGIGTTNPTSKLSVTGDVNVSGISTLGNTVVGGGTTQLIVNGDARITGILTVGTSSITFDGVNNTVTVGSAVTISTSGFTGSGANLSSLNASNLGSGTIPDARFPATLPAVSGANLSSLNASNLGSGTIPDARFPATLPAVSGANLTGIAPFPAGTLMLFQQTAAPTGWTKQTTHNDKALRVVSGAASSGGTTAFTSVFASRTPAGSISVSGSNSGGSIANTTTTGTVANTTLTSVQIPSHSHSYTISNFNNRWVREASGSGKQPGVLMNDGGYGTSTGATGSGGAHNHGLTMNAHNHTFTNPTWSGSGSFTGTAMDFAVQYVDLIIASKN